MKKDQVQSGQRPSRWQSIREFLYGMFGMEIAEHAMEMRGSLESLFMFYIVPNIATWKRRVLREREFSDEHDYHLEGL
jgi:hypothetical protein